MNHLGSYRDTGMLTICLSTFLTVVFDGFLSLIKTSSSMNWVASTIAFFGLGTTKDTAKPECFLPIGGNGSCDGFFSSGDLIFEIIETQL